MATTRFQSRTGGAHARRSAGGAGLVSGARVGLVSTVRSEFTKIRSVRSTYWTLLVMIVVCVGMGALFSAGHVSQVNGAPNAAARAAAVASARSDAVTGSLIGLLIGQLVIAVLGALTITSEYSTGMIRTSLTSMPRRGTVYAAKAIVFGAVALAAGMITSFASFFTGQALLAGVHASASLSHPGVLRAVVGGGLFLAVCGLLSYGIGAILRHSAGAIAAAIGLLFVSWTLSQFLPRPPSGWFGQADIDKWIPFNAGGAIWEHVSGVDLFSPWIGFAVFCSYAAAAMAGGLVLFLRRDA
jgi:ABC-type transport system involved in multi-copper enzyme maturation permease subunit